jgi:hypothetical protein
VGVACPQGALKNSKKVGGESHVRMMWKEDCSSGVPCGMGYSVRRCFKYVSCAYSFRAAADDLGGALRHLSDLIPFYYAFSVLRQVGRLIINTPTCFHGPVRASGRNHQNSVDNPFARLGSLFHQTSRQALGIPIRSSRRAELAGEGVEYMAVSVVMFSVFPESFVVHRRHLQRESCSCSGCIMQLFELPTGIETDANRTLQRLHHVLRHSSPRLFFSFNSTFNFTQPESIRALAAATRIQTARKRVASWPSLAQQVHTACETFLPMQYSSRGLRCSARWDTAQMVDLLAEAGCSLWGTLRSMSPSEPPSRRSGPLRTCRLWRTSRSMH